MKIGRRRLLLAAALLVAVAALFWLYRMQRQPAALQDGAPGTGQAPERRHDLVLSETAGVPSSVDAEQERLVRGLLAAADRIPAGPPKVTVDYPQDGTIVPPDLASPAFLWHDAAAEADRWLVEVTFAGEAGRLLILAPGDAPPRGEIDKRAIAENNALHEGTPYQASARSWRPDEGVWAAITKHSSEKPTRITFRGYRAERPGQVLSQGGLTLVTSRDPVGAPIFYRDVPLMPSQTEEGVIKPLAKGALPLIAWRLKDVSRPDSRVLLTDMPTCANCHSFSADGRTLGLDVDGPQGDKGAYALVSVARDTVIRDQDVMTWNAYAGMKSGLNTLGFLSRVSPDGRFVVSTINESLYVRNFWDYRFNQVFYPTRGILAVYERANGTVRALPGADDPEYVHCDPVFTPDGATLVFARARARDAYIAGRPEATHAGDPNETPIQYDLHRMPFDGGRGGRALPLEGAGANGMSNSFPKVTPDGRYVVYVQSRNGQLMRPDGRLHIVSIDGGRSRPMRCNLPLMNSWHSFSPNGRWMVFSSKSNTPYTQMFLTHLDEKGNDSPAVLIENATAANRAVNIPEFVNVPYDEFRSLSVPAVDASRHFSRGSELALLGKHQEAVVEYEKALAGPLPEWRTGAWRVRGNLSKSLLMLGRRAEALEQVRESLRLNPGNAEMHTNLGYILFADGKADEALRHTDTAIRLAPNDARPRANRATIRLKQGDAAGARADFDEALRLDPEFADAWFGRAVLRRDQGDRQGAFEDAGEALRAGGEGWARRAEAEALRHSTRGAQAR